MKKINPKPPQAEASVRSASGTRLLAAALIGAASVIAAVIYLTPPDDELILEKSQVASSDVPANHFPASAPPPTQAPTESKIHFPTSQQPVDVEHLRQELGELAVQLQSEYPQEAGAFHFAAQIYSELKQTAEAESSWRKSVELGASAPGPYAGLAELLNNSGRESEAIDLLTKAHKAGIQSEETVLQLAVAYENSGQLPEARQELERGLLGYPENPRLWLAKGRVFNQLGEYELGEKSILKHIELAGDSETALFLLSTAQVRQRKTQEAAETRDRLAQFRVNINQEAPDFQTNYESALRNIACSQLISSAALAEQYQRFPEAETHLLRAIQLEPANGQALMSLSSVYRKQNKTGTAIQVHLRLIEVQPNNLLNYSNLASLAFQTGDWQLAETTLLNAEKLEPDGVVAQTSLANLYLALRNLPKAQKYATQVLERKPSVEAHLLMASVYEAMEKLPEAQIQVAKARKLDPQHPIWDTTILPRASN